MLLILPALLLLNACQQGHSETSRAFQGDEQAVGNNPDYWILTDPAADLANYLRTTVSIEGRTKLMMFNHQQNELLIYDTKSRELEKKIAYDHQGPNAVNAVFPSGGIHVISKDSILLYSQLQSTLYFSDMDGTIFKKTRIQNDSIGFGSVFIYSHLALTKDKAWMQSLPHTIGEFATEDYENRPNMFGSIDLKTGATKEYLFDYPEIYQGKDISQQLKMAHILYNASIDKFIISFPLSHDIYVTDLTGYTKSDPAKSSLVGAPLETVKNRKDVGPSAITSHYYWINDKYGQLIYDPVSGYYLREAEKGLSEANFEKRDFATAKEIIVLDKDFNQVATIPHHGGSLLYHFFEGNRIFWNADFTEYNYDRENEDTIYFEQKRFY